MSICPFDELQIQSSSLFLSFCPDVQLALCMSELTRAKRPGIVKVRQMTRADFTHRRAHIHFSASVSSYFQEILWSKQ